MKASELSAAQKSTEIKSNEARNAPEGCESSRGWRRSSHKGLTAETKGETQLVNFPLGTDDLGQAGRLGGGRSREPEAFFVLSHFPRNISTTLKATKCPGRELEIDCDLISTIRLIGCLGKLSWMFKCLEN